MYYIERIMCIISIIIGIQKNLFDFLTTAQNYIPAVVRI